MNHFIKIALLSMAFFAATVSALLVKPNRLYYDNFHNDLALECDNGVWNKNTVIQFYGNGKTIFDSSSKSASSYVASTRLNRTVVLNNSKVGNKGWKDVYCKINKTKSSNSMTLPYIAAPNFRFSPMDFRPFRNYTFQCDGYLLPTTKSSVEFLFNGRAFASITSSKLTQFNNISGLKVYQGANKNNSIIVSPTNYSNNGTYNCALRFTLKDNPLNNATSNSWFTGR